MSKFLGCPSVLGSVQLKIKTKSVQHLEIECRTHVMSVSSEFHGVLGEFPNKIIQNNRDCLKLSVGHASGACPCLESSDSSTSPSIKSWW